MAKLNANDPAFLRDPHTVLDELRANDPVHQDRELDRVVLTRATDVDEVLADRSLSVNPFSARPGAYGRRGFTDADRKMLSLVHLDDPDHARVRGLISQAFNVRSIEALRPRIENLADNLLDNIAFSEEFELTRSYAAPLPILVIAAMLGIDDAEVEQFRLWSGDLSLLFKPERSAEEGKRLGSAREQIYECFGRTLARRRAEPHDDVISGLAAAEAEGERLTEIEILNTCRTLLAAGNITTCDLIGNGVVTLLRHPGQLDRLRADPQLWPMAIEEILRYDAPVSMFLRQNIEQREIAGCPVEAGQTISLMLLAANHDPALHECPHVFDVERTNQKHHSFGGGAHFCLGASLARLEAQVALAKLFERFPKLHRISTRALQRRPHPTFNGYEEVWLSAA